MPFPERSFVSQLSRMAFPFDYDFCSGWYGKSSEWSFHYLDRLSSKASGIIIF